MKSANKKSGIYIHFPFCKVKCGYCDFYSIANKEHQINDYFKHLHKEIDMFANQLNHSYSFNTLFIGGGTPSLASAHNIEKLLTKLNDKFDLSNLEEFTMEANPGEAPKELLIDLKSIGVNRISFGFQSLDPEILKFLDRIHSPRDCLNAFHDARESGIKNINVDMIFNIPNQSIRLIQRDLKQILALGPDHISNYSLTVEPGTPLYELVNSRKVIMPDEETDIKMFQMATDLLGSNGYHQYEVSNFSKKGKQCLHNLHYWNLDPYLAFGPSAHGFYNKKRYWNIKDLNYYNQKLESGKLPIEGSEILETQNIFNEIILNSLKISEGINMNDIKNRFNQPTFNLLSKKILDWGTHLEQNRKNIRLTKKGYFIADEITLDLMNSYSSNGLS